jgi:antitoxin (DNA-binding transcriptional repressor) of toxin-antitoxin stability system
MEAVGVGDLKERADEIVRRVSEEQTSFAVTLRGEVVARIVPEQRGYPKPEDLTEFWEALDSLIASVAEKVPANASAEDVIRDIRREL